MAERFYSNKDEREQAEIIYKIKDEFIGKAERLFVSQTHLTQMELYIRSGNH